MIEKKKLTTYSFGHYLTAPLYSIITLLLLICSVLHEILFKTEDAAIYPHKGHLINLEWTWINKELLTFIFLFQPQILDLNEKYSEVKERWKAKYYANPL